jgi:hypothetical protein
VTAFSLTKAYATDNPTGRCYDRSALIAYGRFAELNDLHLVFDEVSEVRSHRTEREKSGSLTSVLCLLDIRNVDF